MAFRVLPDGTVEIDTAEELLEYQKLKEASEKASPPQAPEQAAAPDAEAATSAGLDEKWVKLCEAAERSWLQQALLRFVKDAGPGGISLAEVVAKTGAKSGNTVGGSYSGLNKTARSLGLDPMLVIVKDAIKGHYVPGPLLKRKEVPWSVDEVLQVAQPSSTEATTKGGTFAKFCEVIVEPRFSQEHRIVAIVAGHGEKGVTLDAVKRVLKIDDATLGAKYAHVGRACKKAGIPKEEIIYRDQDFFLPGAMLLNHRDELPPVAED